MLSVRADYVLSSLHLPLVELNRCAEWVCGRWFGGSAGARAVVGWRMTKLRQQLIDVLTLRRYAP
ncbi:MAG TPA: hypothetical protein VIS96_16715, partial [Terrimicrobiaceae bacterium]